MPSGLAIEAFVDEPAKIGNKYILDTAHAAQHNAK